ncbi:MAG: Dabb family protein [Armatimonadota bacterium]
MSREVIHIVLFRWNDDVTKETIELIKQELLNLRNEVSGVLDTYVGDDFSTRSKGYHTALCTRFVDKQALLAYGPSDAHQRVVTEFVRPNSSDILAFDFEI